MKNSTIAIKGEPLEKPPVLTVLKGGGGKRKKFRDSPPLLAAPGNDGKREKAVAKKDEPQANGQQYPSMVGPTQDGPRARFEDFTPFTSGLC
ncbi:MAG: hypothetical protein WC861_03570 [Candidatus Micrarchaeia archaeon]